MKWLSLSRLAHAVSAQTQGPTRDQVLDELTDKGCVVSSGVGLQAVEGGMPMSEVSRRRVRTALDELEAQGMIRFVYPLDWPDLFVVRPG